MTTSNSATSTRASNTTGIIAMLPPNFLVVVPEDLAAHITDFEASGGLADPVGHQPQVR